MSNHDGSRMLNDVIALLRREGVFDRLGKAHSQRIVAEMVNRAYDEHDCRHFEILDGHGAALGLCWDCMEPSEDIRADLCPKCRRERDDTEEDVKRAERDMRRSSWFDPQRSLAERFETGTAEGPSRPTKAGGHESPAEHEAEQVPAVRELIAKHRK